jgi:hypothetical protein
MRGIIAPICSELCSRDFWNVIMDRPLFTVACANYGAIPLKNSAVCYSSLVPTMQYRHTVHEMSRRRRLWQPHMGTGNVTIQSSQNHCLLTVQDTLQCGKV